MTSIRSNVIAALAAAVVAFLVLLALMSRDVAIFDEGIVLAGALRTLAGEIPHRDYYSSYGPAQNYVVAFLFAMFGKSFMVERLYSLATMALVATFAFVTTWGRVRWFFSVLVLVFCVAFQVGSQFHLYPVFPVMLLSLLGAFALIRSLGSGNQPGILAAVFAGACCGVAALFRYDGGFFLLLSFCLFLAIMQWLRPTATPFRSLTVNLLICGMASGLVFVPFALSYLLVAPPGGFVHDIIDYSLNVYPKVRSLPFPGLVELKSNPGEIGVYFPLIVLAVTAWECFASKIWRQQSPQDLRQLPLIVMMAILSFVLYYKGMVRVSTVHMLMSIIPATILIGVVMDRVATRLGWKRAIPLMIVITLAPALVAMSQIRKYVGQPDNALAGWVLLTPAPANACAAIDGAAFVNLGEDFRAAGRFIKRHTKQGEKIVVAAGRHDKIFANAIAFYFEADRLPGTRWHQFDPGLQNLGEVQQQIIDDLKRNRVNWIVRDSTFDSVLEPNDSAKSSGVRLLDQYLTSNYRPVARAGKIEIWLARTLPAPEPIMGMECIAAPVTAVTGA